MQQYAWFKDNARRMTHPVGEKKPNAWGLYDMHGNVGQWCAEWFSEGYAAPSSASDLRGSLDGSSRVSRGGIWQGHAFFCRSAYRNLIGRDARNPIQGFRVVCEIPWPGAVAASKAGVPSPEYSVPSREPAGETGMRKPEREQR